MNVILVRTKLHHHVNGVQVMGPHRDIQGDVMGLLGDTSNVRGDASGIWGDISGLRGDVTGFLGCVTGIHGNLDDCGITDEDRKRGLFINDLVEG